MNAVLKPVPSDSERDLRAEIAESMRSGSLSQAAVAREAGLSSTILNQWLGRKYPGDNLGVEVKLEQWLDAWHIRQSRERSLPEAPAWIEMPTAARIVSTLSYAQYAGDIVVVYGSAGVCKTQTCEHYAETNPNVWLATMSPATATVVPALEEVAEAVGLREVSTGAARIQRAIIRRIKGTYGLLIVDEAQHLGVGALDALRALHDATGLGLALVGNETVYARMTGGNRAAYLDRLYSRIGKRLYLRRASAADVDALIGGWKLRDKSCVELCRQIAAKPGGLRVLNKTLRLGAMFAAGAGRPLCCTDIRAAWRELGGA